MVEKSNSYDVETFVTKMDELMGIERQAEMDETANLLERFTFKELERRNLAVAKLYIKEVSTGIYGRVIV